LEFNGAEYSRLSYLNLYQDDLPKEGGMYFWVHWVDFDVDKITDFKLKDLLLAYTEQKIPFMEEMKGTYKFSVSVTEQWYLKNGNIFGLSDSKEKELLDFLKDLNNRKKFYQLFKEICFARPFYIGKADDLRIRLNQHLKRRSNILDTIDNHVIKHANIYIGYKIIESPKDLKLNVIFEEIFNRTVKPGLTKKPN
jgi:hypothetical protein